MGLSLVLAALVWGLAEATLFFVVPDVLLTFMALEDRRAAVLASGAAVVGALAGGLVMYAMGAADPEAAVALLDAVPAISPDMIERVRSSLSASGLMALFLGPLTGTPYKIYAAISGSLGVGLWPFLLVSVPARGVRFVALAFVTSWASRGPFAAWPRGRKWLVLALLWAVFYAGYFAVHAS
jgi:membrane protein YqaA with SNARE-associated domain